MLVHLVYNPTPILILLPANILRVMFQGTVLLANGWQWAWRTATSKFSMPTKVTNTNCTYTSHVFSPCGLPLVASGSSPLVKTTF